MPVTLFHQLTATTPPPAGTTFEIETSNWNQSHVGTFAAIGSELIGAFSNANGVSFGLGQGGAITASVASTAGLLVIASNATVNVTQLAFVNSNGVSFGLNGSTITASTPSTAGLISNIALSADGSFGPVTGISFRDSNGISFGNSNGVITASVLGTNGIAGIADSANTLSSGTLVFSNSHGMAFGLNAGTLTASYTQAAQSTQTLGLYAAGQTFGQSSSTTNAGTALSFAGSGVASVGYSNGSVVFNVPGGTGTGIGAIAGTVTQSTGYVNFSNANGVTFGLAGGVMTATVTPGPSAGLAAVEAGGTTLTVGTVSFGNSNGLSWGLNGSTLTASYTQPSTAGLISGVGFSAGTASGNATGVVFSNSNGITFGYNNGTITASGGGAQSTQPVAVSGSNGSYAFSTLNMGALNGLTFYSSNGSMVGSYTVPNTSGALTALNVSAAGAAANVTGLVFQNANNLTFGLAGNTITGSVIGNQLQFSAGAQINNSSGYTFSNSNGVSFGLNNGTITASVGAGAGGAGPAISAGTQLASSGTLLFANSNGISFGLSNSNQVTAAYTVPNIAGLISGVSVSGGTQTTLANNLVFSNSNGISFGLNNGTITGSYIPGAGATGSYLAVGNTTGAAAGSIVNFSSLNIQAAGIISVGFSSNSMIISGPATTTAPQLSIGMSNIGNTVGSSGLVGNQMLLVPGNNISFSGSTNAGGSATITMYAAAGSSGGGNTSGGVYALGNTTGQTSYASYAQSALSVSFAGLVSGGWTNGSLLVSAPGTTGITNSVYALGNTTSASSGTQGFGSLAVSALGGITAGMNAGTLLLSGAAGGTVGVSVSGALSLTTSTNASGSNFSFSSPATSTISGVGNITVSTAGSTIFVSGSGGGGIALAGSNTTYTSGTVSLVNSNGMSFGSAAGGISASYTVPSQVSVYALGNTTQNSSSVLPLNALSFNGLGEATVGFSNGSIQLSIPPSSIGVAGGNTSGTSGYFSGAAAFQGGNNITLSVSTAAGGAQTIVVSGPNVGGAQTGISGIFAGTQTQTVGTLSFANSNGVSFGLSNSSVLTASIAAQTNQTLGLYASSNTTGASSSTTVDARSLTFVGSGGMSIGMSNGSVVFNDGPLLYLSAGTTSINANAAGTVVFGNSNGVSFGFNGSTITGSISPATTAAYFFAGNTTGASSSGTLGDQTVSISAAGILSAGWTNGSLVFSATQSNQAFSASGGSTTFQTLNFANSNGVTFLNSAGSLVASVAPTSSLSGINGVTVSTNGSTVSIGEILRSRADFWPQVFSSSTLSQQASASLRYVQLAYPVTFSRVDVPVVVSLASAATAATAALYFTSGLVIYSRNGSTLSPLTGAFGSTTLSWASNTSNYANLTGGRNLSFPVAGSLSAGEYWVGVQVSTTGGSVGATTTNLGNSIYMPYGIVDTSDQFGDFGSTYSASQNLSSHGLYTATIGATNATLAMANILATGVDYQGGNFPVIFRNY